MADKVQRNQQLVHKVLRELSQNEHRAMKRYKFLKTMPKSLRPIEYQESLASWEEAIRQYNDANKLR